jgi:Ribbon-helix-helix domain
MCEPLAMLDTMSDIQDQQSATRKVRTVFMLGPAEREALEKISEDTGAPQSELIRRAVTQYLSTREGARA